MGRTVYDQLGVRPILNAAGTFTEFGGSRMSREVVAAWSEAAEQFVDLRELQLRVGQRIASLLQVEAALVTGGAASGILLATAAAITQRDADFPTMKWSARPTEPYEVLRQHAHRDLYDRQLEACGVRIVDVHSAAEFQRRVNARTVMMMAYNYHEPSGKLDHRHWLELASRHGIPTLLDAAADTPPVANLWKYIQLGYDLVVFSGGKALRGPQDTGLLLGRHSLIELARQNASPNEGTVGRVAKVSKEDMVALWKAVEQYVHGEGDLLWTQCARRLDHLESVLSGVDSLSTQRIVPAVANRFPHLLLFWDERQLGVTRDELRRQLRDGDPPVVTGRVAGTGEDGFLISVINLKDGEEQIVGQRIRQILAS